MEIFGVSPLEFFIVAVLGLIIFGPERLPEIGRFLGRTVAKVLAWQYTSPEAQMLSELRRDFEKQIYEIRDEMVQASKQLDVRPELQEIQRETEALLRGQVIAPPAERPKLDQIHLEAPQPTIAPPTLEVVTPAEMIEPVPVPEPLVSTNGTGLSHAPALPSAEVELLTTQIRALTADLHALQEQLRAHGVLTAEWQPPSREMQDEVQDVDTLHESQPEEMLHEMEPEETI